MKSQLGDSDFASSLGPNRNQGSELRKSRFKGKDTKRLPSIIRKRRLNEIELRKQKRNSTTEKHRNELLVRDLYTNIDLRRVKSTYRPTKEDELVGIQTAFDSLDEETKLEAVRVLEHLAEADPANVERIVQRGMHLKLLELAIWGGNELALAALLMLITIIGADFRYTDHILQANGPAQLIHRCAWLGPDQITLHRQIIYFSLLLMTDSEESRQTVLNHGGLHAVISFLRYAQPFCLKPLHFQRAANEIHLDERVAACFIYNTLKGSSCPPEEFSDMKDGPSTAIVLYNLLGVSDVDTISEVCQALASLFRFSDATNTIMTHAPLLGPRLVKLLGASNDPTTQDAIVKVLGSIILGPPIYMEKVLSWDTLATFRPLLLASTDDTVRKNICWALGNIAAGNSAECIQVIIDSNIAPLLINILTSHDVSSAMKREACWAICNMLSGEHATLSQIEYLVSQGCIPPLANEMITRMDNSIVVISLEALMHILKAGDIEKEQKGPHAQNQNAAYIEEASGVVNVNQLLSSTKNEQIFTLCCQLIDQYFSDTAEGHIAETPKAISIPRERSEDENMSDGDKEIRGRSLEPISNGSSFVFQTGRPSRGFSF